MTEKEGTFIKWIDEKRQLCLVSYTEVIEPLQVSYDFTLFPCSHKILNLTYKPVDIDGHYMCPECKRIREIEIIRRKSY